MAVIKVPQVSHPVLEPLAASLGCQPHCVCSPRLHPALQAETDNPARSSERSIPRAWSSAATLTHHTVASLLELHQMTPASVRFHGTHGVHQPKQTDCQHEPLPVSNRRLAGFAWPVARGQSSVAATLDESTRHKMLLIPVCQAPAPCSPRNAVHGARRRNEGANVCAPDPSV